jgi:uncharacterized membrane protein
MTDERRLRELGLEDYEIDEMRENGALASMEMSVQAGRALAQRYLDIGDTDNAEICLDAALKNANYWETKIYEVTGKNIVYEDSTDHWRNMDTGQYTKNPYIDIRVDNSQLEDWINFLYS